MEYHYSKQLIQDIASQLDPDLIRFFNKTADIYKYPARDVMELVNESMNSILQGKETKDELSKVFKRIYNNRLKLRQAWYVKLLEDLEKIDVNSAKYPFHQIVSAYNALDEEQLELLYGNGSLEDIIDIQLKSAEKWAHSNDSYLTSFIQIHSKTPKKVYNALLSDVFIDLYGFLKEQYAGSIKNYFMSLPKEISKIPFFGLGSGKLNLKERDEEGNYIQDYEFGDIGSKKSLRMIVVNADAPVLAIGGRDKRIITECIKYLESDFYRTRRISVKRSELAKLFSSSDHLSRASYERMERRCLNLTNYKYQVYDKELNKEIASINLMDSVDVSDSEVVTFVFGSFLYKSILNNELTNIKTTTLQLLKNPMSELLCQFLCEERIILSNMERERNAGSVGTYSYSFFRSVVRLPARQKQANIARIRDSLQEYVSNKVIVESFVMRGAETFEIHFYPLTEEEWADVEYNKKHRSETINGTLIEGVI